jgi:hypothetical protein
MKYATVSGDIIDTGSFGFFTCDLESVMRCDKICFGVGWSENFETVESALGFFCESPVRLLLVEDRPPESTDAAELSTTGPIAIEVFGMRFPVAALQSASLTRVNHDRAADMDDKDEAEDKDGAKDLRVGSEGGTSSSERRASSTPSSFPNSAEFFASISAAGSSAYETPLVLAA